MPFTGPSIPPSRRGHVFKPSSFEDVSSIIHHFQSSACAPLSSSLLRDSSSFSLSSASPRGTAVHERASFLLFLTSSHRSGAHVQRTADFYTYSTSRLCAHNSLGSTLPPSQTFILSHSALDGISIITTASYATELRAEPKALRGSEVGKHLEHMNR